MDGIPMRLRSLICALALAPVSASAATFDYSKATASLFWDATLMTSTSTGEPTGTGPVTIPLAPNAGGISGSVLVGDLTGGGGTIGGAREYAGQVEGALTALLQATGFSIDLSVFARAICVVNETAGTCAPAAQMGASLAFDFTVDQDTTVTLAGPWEGGLPGISTVDYFDFVLGRYTGNPFNPFELVDIDGRTATSGALNQQVSLLASESYFVTLSNSASAAANNATTDVTDSGSVAFTLGDVTPVPLPGALPALLAGLGLLAVAGARNQRRSA
jgi:hypothetical protein